MAESESPVVFLSYSHDSVEHMEGVLALPIRKLHPRLHSYCARANSIKGSVQERYPIPWKIVMQMKRR